MILTTLPDLPPRPETACNAPFRRRFYERWGLENAVICGRATEAEYAAIPQTLSIKMATGGRERYVLPRRELVVDADNLLVLDEGACYGSRLEADAAGRPAWTFAVFFRPGMQHEVAAQVRRGLPAALDAPDAAPVSAGFAERLRPRGGALSLRLDRLAAQVQDGERDEAWLEGELTLLLGEMLRDEQDPQAAATPRPALKAELRRRLRRAADHIESHYERELSLTTLAEVANLSRFHFVRAFAAEYGLSPHAYLTRKRAQAARRLLAAGLGDRDWVAQRCGLGTRWSLQRALQRHGPGTP